MAIKRMDHIGVVVDDLNSAIAFFIELGMELEGKASVEGDWVDRVLGLDGVQADIATVQTPDGHSRIELSTVKAPSATSAEPNAPANIPGMRHIAFVVDDVDDTLARLRAHGSQLVGSVEQYEDIYRLCYVRGPQGIIVELAQELKSS